MLYKCFNFSIAVLGGVLVVSNRWNDRLWKENRALREELGQVKRIKWQGMADGYADAELVYDVWTCSACGHVIETDDLGELPVFCSSCGVKHACEAK